MVFIFVKDRELSVVLFPLNTSTMILCKYISLILRITHSGIRTISKHNHGNWILGILLQVVKPGMAKTGKELGLG